MGLNIGDINVKGVKLGSIDVTAIYLGDVKVYPNVETRVVTTYNVTSTSSPTQLCYSNAVNQFSEIEIDGVKQPSVVSAYTFNTTGEHTVKYKLTDPTTIGTNAFDGCSRLTSIDIPNSVTSIGPSAFFNCSGLTSIDIPDSVTSIGTSAFRYCSGLTSCTIGSGVTSIGSSAFQYCSGLTSCTIGSGVTSIGYSAFNGCRSLTSIDIPSGVTTIGSSTFQNCTSLTSCTIGSGATSIGDSAFSNCSGLTSIVIPSGVTSMGHSAFTHCNSLTSITIEATTPPTLSDTNAFTNTNNCPIYVPCDSVDAYKAANNWSTYASRIEAIPGSCPVVVTAKFNVTSTSSRTRIASATTGFSKIEIDGVEQPSVTTGYTFGTLGNHTVKYYLKNTIIGGAAFRYCTSLTTCTIGSGVTIIGNSAFTYCTSLTSIEIPDSVTTIGGVAFRDCTSLTSIDIPSGVTNIGNYAFYNCSSLTNIVIPSGVTTIGQYTFSNCRSLTSIDIPSGVTSIANNAFEYCSGLTSIDIPDSVTSIGTYAFNRCSGLTSIDIPSGVTRIGQYTFYNCSSLTSVTVEATTPPTLGGDAFYSTNNCPIYVPCDSVDTYKAATNGWSSYASRIQAIQGTCWDITAKFNVTDTTNPTRIASATTGFSKIEIDGVEQPSVTTGYTFNTLGEHRVKYMLTDPTSIGNAAFSGCYGLTTVTIGSGVTSIGESAFRYCTSLTSIVCNAVTAPTITRDVFQDIKTGGTLTVPIGSSGYDVWMGTGNYYLGKYSWTKVEQ